MMTDLEPAGAAPLLVGQSSPLRYNARPLPLYPWPPNCAGHRLWQHCQATLGARLFGQDHYLRTFRRINGLEHPCDTFARRDVPAERVRDLLALFRDGSQTSCVVYLGPAVAHVFRHKGELLRWCRDVTEPYTWVIFPHPSGRNHSWNDPVRKAAAREFLAELIDAA